MINTCIPSSSAALESLIVFLTRPLYLTHHFSTINFLKYGLRTALEPLFPPKQPFTFAFVPGALPPPPFLISCEGSSIPWQEWFEALGGKEMHFFITATSVTVGPSADGKGTLPIWTANSGLNAENSDEVKSISKTCTRIVKIDTNVAAVGVPTNVDVLRRRRPTVVARAIKLPCLVKILPVPALVSANDSPSSDLDDNSDSDSESTTSSRFSFDSDSSSTPSSISSLSSPITPASDLPSCDETAVKGDQLPAVPITSVKPAAKYLYQGGSTNVLTGGVMLGAASASAVAKPRPAAPLALPTKVQTPTRVQTATGTRSNFPVKRTALRTAKGSDSDNWRRRV